MRDDLLYYYERELTYLRRLGAEFAEKYPKVASRLLLEPTKCDDPHVERLLEGFAFLAARIHLKLDDDFPEISEALLNVVYPNYLRPIPSMSLVEFHLDPEQGKLTTGLQIPRHAQLYSRPVNGAPCRFRTCYDTTLWPLTVTAAQWQTPDRLKPPIKASDAVAALRVELQCLPDVAFDKLELQRLRLHLHGEPALTATLYELLCSRCRGIVIRDPAAPKRPPVLLPPSALHPVGFAEDEGLLPFPLRSFLGYRLLQEYSTFPTKFLFLDLAGFEQVRAAGFGNRAEVVFLIAAFERDDRRELLESGVSKTTIRLGCAPIINLFPQTSEPVILTQRAHEYPVVADARRRQTTRVFSVEDVTAVSAGADQATPFEPLYSFRHGSAGRENQAFWYARRRPRGWRLDEGSDLFLSFVDAAQRPVQPPFDAATCRLTCFNGDLPSRLPFGDDSGDFELPGGGPVQRIVTLVKPTPVVEPPLGRPVLWRLISQLSLNYLSLVSGGAEGLQELLRLNNFGDTTSGEKQIQGLLSVRSAPCHARIDSAHGLTFARGHRVELEFDEEQFVGGGVYLFATVLERFLGMYTSLNSFTIVAARSQQRKELLHEWAPRAGWKALV
ncbi:MAG: type VI secretion system baseplate subunit TssF [Gemmatimonadota bacterium]|nr:type VI secretion system baseplate subunit TssF [Gemmatimonadota bacterium]